MTSSDPTPWDALGDPTRRAIFERLVDQPRAVGELAQDLPVSRPAVSQHLAVLKAAGLVTDRAEGTRRVYAISPVGLERLRADLDRFWTPALAAFKAAAERREPDAGQAEAAPAAARSRRRSTKKPLSAPSNPVHSSKSRR